MCHHLNLNCNIALSYRFSLACVRQWKLETEVISHALCSLMFMVFVSYSQKGLGKVWARFVGAHQLIRVVNAGFNDAFIVPTVAGGVPRDGRKPGQSVGGRILL